MAPLRTRLSRLLSATPIADLPVRVRRGFAQGARWTAFPFSSNWRDGGSEIDVVSAVARLRSVKGAVFWDFGAHFGIHTVGMAMAVGDQGQSVGFEPDPVAFAKLSRHVAMNSLRNVVLYNAAVSSSNGIGQLYFPLPAGSACSHFKYYEDHDLADIPSAAVRSVSADSLVARSEIRLPDLIKIDVQGHGGSAIEGAIKSIAAARPIIAFSNHSDRERAEAKGLLEPLGYAPEAFDGRRLSWGDITECLLLPT